MDHVQRPNRHDMILFSERLDDYIAEDNPVRFLAAVVDELMRVQRSIMAVPGFCCAILRLHWPSKSGVDSLPPHG